jgi:hypothetical protein
LQSWLSLTARWRDVFADENRRCNQVVMFCPEDGGFRCWHSANVFDLSVNVCFCGHRDEGRALLDARRRSKRVRIGRPDLSRDFPVIRIKFPVLQKDFPVNLLREFAEMSLGRSGFLRQDRLFKG